MQKTSPLMEQYQRIKKDHQDKILFFRMGDFFEMFDRDAEIAAPILNIALTYRNKKAGLKTKMCGLPHHSISAPISKLLEKGLSVAICDQIEPAESAKGAVVKRAVVRSLSPGMVYNPETLDQLSANYMGAFDKKHISFLDLSTGSAFYYEISSIEDSYKLLSRFHPKELVVRSSQRERLKQAKFFSSFSFSVFDKMPTNDRAFFSSLDLKKHESAPESAKRLLYYVFCMQGRESLKLIQLFEKQNKGQEMYCSSQLYSHLEVFKNYEGLASGSLFSAVNRTKTPGGARLLKHRLKSPLTSVERIEHRLNQIDRWMAKHSLLEPVRKILSQMGDGERKLSKIVQQNCNAKDIFHLSLWLEKGLQLEKLLSSTEGLFLDEGDSRDDKSSTQAGSFLEDGNSGSALKLESSPSNKLESSPSNRLGSSQSNNQGSSQFNKLEEKPLPPPIKKSSPLEALKEGGQQALLFDGNPTKPYHQGGSSTESLQKKEGTLSSSVPSSPHTTSTNPPNPPYQGGIVQPPYQGGIVQPSPQEGHPTQPPHQQRDHSAKPSILIQKAEVLMKKIQSVLSPSCPVSIKEGGMVNPGVNPQLDEWMDLAKNAKELLLKMETEERQKLDIPSLKIRYNSVFGYYIEIRKIHSSKVPPFYKRKQTLVAAERYSTQELATLEEKILSARAKQIEMEYHIFKDLRAELLEQINLLLKLCRHWTEIDLYSSLAFSALENSYVRPRFTTSRFKLKSSRHPVLEQKSFHEFVPNTIDMSKGKTLILTGPNMAGKSTLMRQAALTVLLAQSGCFVPASEAELPIFHKMFTRIGASDSLSKGMSTFMVEMKETAEILQKADAKSLIILDEIGRGTATFDGMSLARAILEFLTINRKPFLFSATHYGELAEFANHSANAQNARMAIREDKDKGKIHFLYLLKPGSAGKSYGVQVARLAGFPQGVLDRAEHLLKKLEAGRKANSFTTEALTTEEEAPIDIKGEDTRDDSAEALTTEKEAPIDMKGETLNQKNPSTEEKTQKSNRQAVPLPPPQADHLKPEEALESRRDGDSSHQHHHFKTLRQAGELKTGADLPETQNFQKEKLEESIKSLMKEISEYPLMSQSPINAMSQIEKWRKSCSSILTSMIEKPLKTKTFVLDEGKSSADILN